MGASQVEWSPTALLHWTEITSRLSEFLKKDVVDRTELHRLTENSAYDLYILRLMLNQIDVEYLVRELSKTHFYNGTTALNMVIQYTLIGSSTPQTVINSILGQVE